MKIKNVKAWKTTTLGIILIVASIASVFVQSVSWSDASFGIGIGLVLIFSPDTILSRFEKFVK
jgi:FtsH-binding integral membrane protein